MFKSVDELKAFITWAKNNHVKRVKVGEIEVEVSDIAFIPEFNSPNISHTQANPELIASIPANKEQEAIKEDEDLFWSVSN
jgi:hypothetical protein